MRAKVAGVLAALFVTAVLSFITGYRFGWFDGYDQFNTEFMGKRVKMVPVDDLPAR